VFYADTDTDRKHRVVIATDTLDNDQKTFKSQHCWLNTADSSTSMCHGDLYISVQREPTGHFITYELDGAAFTKSNAAAVAIDTESTRTEFLNGPSDLLRTNRTNAILITLRL
jgi:hypothetical protein